MLPTFQFLEGFFIVCGATVLHVGQCPLFTTVELAFSYKEEVLVVIYQRCGKCIASEWHSLVIVLKFVP